MKSFFKKLAAIACKFNIELKRDEKPNDEADSGYDFTLDGVCYTLCAKKILPTLYGQKAVQGWGVCGHKIHPASRKHPEEKEDASIGSSAVAESLVDDVLLAHLKWRIQVEEDGYSHGQEGSLDARRRNAAQSSFEAYDFDFKVAECSGWEFDGSDTFRRPVFSEPEEGPSKKITYYVEFKPHSEEIVSQGMSE
jgi:hypothetical protein